MKKIIWGAGKCALHEYELLYYLGLEKDVLCFVVSERKDNPYTIDGRPVLEFDEAKDLIKGNQIIVAVYENNSAPIWEKLKKNHLDEYARQVKLGEYSKRKLQILNEIPINNRKIIVSSFDGQNYGGNCKYIIDKLLDRRSDLDIVWTRRDNTCYPIDILRKEERIVEIDTKEYYYEMASAHIVITDNMPDYRSKKKEGQFYLNTWHGAGPFKLVGTSVKSRNDEQKKVYASIQALTDCFIAASDDCIQMYRESMRFKGEILKCGYPRNDIFFNSDNELKNRIKEEIGIKPTDKIVLYAPTFRDIYSKYSDSFYMYNIEPREVVKALGERFDGEFRLLYRFHHDLIHEEVPDAFRLEGIDVTRYQEVQELLLIADILITDYSSIMWDFTLTGRPIFLYQYDANVYSVLKGFYLEIDKWPYPKSNNMEGLIDNITQFDEEEYKSKINAFLTKYGSFDDGFASERVAKRLLYEIDCGAHA